MFLYREFTLLKKLQMKLKQTLDLIVGYHLLINPITTRQGYLLSPQQYIPISRDRAWLE